MRRLTFPLACLFVSACSGSDGGDVDRMTQLRDSAEGPLAVRTEHDAVRTVRGKIPVVVSGSATAKAEAFLTTWADLFGLPTEATTSVLRASEVAAPGRVVVVFERLHEGVPVLGAEIRVHVAGDFISFVSSALPTELGVSTSPTLAEADAIASAATALGRAEAELEVIGTPALVVFNRGLFSGEATPSTLAYQLGARVRGASVAWSLLIDAHDGSRRAAIDMAPATLTRSTYTANNMSGYDDTLRGAATLWFDEARGMVDPSADQQGADAHDLALLIYDYYDAILGWTSYDDMSSPLDTYVHHNPAPGANARWYDGAMWFEDGMVTHDIFAHELTHGVVEHSAKLVYLLESGAVNESVADTFAAFATRTTSWEIGDGSALGVIRSLSHPSAYGQPESYADRQQLGSIGSCSGPLDCSADSCVSDTGECIAGCTPPSACTLGECIESSDPCANDSGGVHANSGILNRAAWLATAPDQSFAVGTEMVSGIGSDKAEQIYFLALTAYMGPSTSLKDTRDMVVDSCTSHTFLFPVLGIPDFGITPRDCGVVINAFAQVGLGAPDTDLDAWDDQVDNCPDVANPFQEDANRDGKGDACTEDVHEPDAGAEIAPTSVDCPETFDTRSCDDQGLGACPDGNCVNPMPATWNRFTGGVARDTPEFVAGSQHYTLLCGYKDAADFCQANFRLYWAPRGAVSSMGGSPAWAACDNPGAIIRDCTLNSSTHRAATTIPCLADGVDPSWQAEVMAAATARLALVEAEAQPCP